MEKRTFRVSFRPEDIACTPPCGMEAALQSIDEMIWGILGRYADESDDNNVRFGSSDVESQNGLVTIYPGTEEDTAKVTDILRQYFRVHETAE